MTARSADRRDDVDDTRLGRIGRHLHGIVAGDSDRRRLGAVRGAQKQRTEVDQAEGRCHHVLGSLEPLHHPESLVSQKVIETGCVVYPAAAATVIGEQRDAQRSSPDPQVTSDCGHKALVEFHEELNPGIISEEVHDSVRTPYVSDDDVALGGEELSLDLVELPTGCPYG